MRNPYEKEYDDKNIDADNSLFNGCVLSIPAAIVGGVFGAIASIVGGMVYSNKQRKTSKNFNLTDIKQMNVVYDQYENMTYTQLKEIINQKFDDINKVKRESCLLPSSAKIIKYSNPKFFVREYDRLCKEQDFRKVYLVYSKSLYNIGFYANGTYHFADQDTAKNIKIAISMKGE